MKNCQAILTKSNGSQTIISGIYADENQTNWDADVAQTINKFAGEKVECCDGFGDELFFWSEGNTGEHDLKMLIIDRRA